VAPLYLGRAGARAPGVQGGRAAMPWGARVVGVGRGLWRDCHGGGPLDPYILRHATTSMVPDSLQQFVAIRFWQRVVVAPLTHASHHRPTLVHLSRFRVSPILTHNRFRGSCSRFRRFMRFLWSEAISQRVFISRGRARAHWKVLVKAHMIA
jgi:hypothetical protein